MKKINFILPVGYQDDSGEILREGVMRAATALDEIEIQNDERLNYHKRYHDLLLLSRVILRLGTIENITVEHIENLYEVDFRYLQTLYHELNNSTDTGLVTRCPKCRELNRINLTDVYKNIDFYFMKNKNTKEGENPVDQT